MASSSNNTAAVPMAAQGPLGTHGHSMNVLNPLLLIIAGIIVTVRLYVRLIHTRAFGLDDFLIAIAFCAAIVLMISIQVGILKDGGNLHTVDINHLAFVPYLRASWVGQFGFFIASGTTKMSILFYYRRISTTLRFQNRLDRVVKVIDILNVLSLGYMLCCIIFLLAQCRPISYYWTLADPTSVGRCFQSGFFPTAMGIINILLDFAILLLSVSLTSFLKVPARQKLLLTMIFSAGGLVCIACIFRVYLVSYVYNKSTDVVWDAYYTWLLSVLEVNLGVICASLPACKTLVQSLWDRRKGKAGVDLELSMSESGNGA